MDGASVETDITSSESYARVNGLDICYETLGEPSGEPLLLVMGLGGPLIWWDDEFCRRLTGRGFWVIRYDNRDCGRSSRIEGAPRPRPLRSLLGDTRSAAYTLDDMAADAAGLLDHLGVAPAHVMGVSMGGMIAQTLAIRHAERVRSLVSIMSTTGRRTVGWASPSVARLLLRTPPRDRTEYVERTVRMLRRISSPGFPFDAERMRRRAEATFDRGLNPVGTARQMVAIAASGDRTEALGRVRAPALVVHGRHDPLIHVSGGIATSRALPDAELRVIEGMGHDLPRPLWPSLADDVERLAARAA
jgi:pimeloyl-ACP methyl ester carboxylesterase